MMDDESEYTVSKLDSLLLKRKQLADLRDEILKSHNQNKRRKTIEIDTDDDLDFNSDDSVKDKDYEPEVEDGYNSSGSHDSFVTKRRKAQVKKRIFSSEKSYSCSKLSASSQPLQSSKLQSYTDNNDDSFITLEDLLGTQKHTNSEYTCPDTADESFLNSPDIFGEVYHSPPPKKQKQGTEVNVNSNIVINTFGELSDSDDESSGKKTVAEINNNERCKVFPSLRKLIITSKRGEYRNSEQGIMTADNNGTIFLPNNINNGSLINNTYKLQEINSNREKTQHFSNRIIDLSIMAVDEHGTIHLPNIRLNNDKFFQIPCDVSPAAKSGARKKQTNKFKWKRIASKIARLKGSPYHSTVAKIKQDVKAREVKPPCNCKAKCYEKVPEERRQEIFNQFWKKCQSWDQRRQFIVSSVEKINKRVMKTSGNLETDRRKFSYIYNLTTGFNSRQTVCKVMFMNTLSVGEKFVRVSLEKQLDCGMTAPDQRGRHVPANKSPEPITVSVMNHINSYPCYESHYSRERTSKKYLGPDLSITTMYQQYQEAMKEKGTPPEHIAKQWLYRQIFNTKFNLSFKLPSVDTCDDCDELQRKIQDAKDETENEQIQKEKELHDKVAQERYELKKKDKKDAEESSGRKKVLMFDLQKCLATPNLTNTKSFYLRKLWTLNLTLFDATGNNAINMMWSENIAGRGGNEIASCLLRWADENSENVAQVEELIFYSDNCAGQNRNLMVVMAYFSLLNKFSNLKLINHKFMLKGHTHMEVDQVHAQIEKKKKALKTMQIAIPRDWSQFVQTCGGKRPFVVHNMGINDFKDLTSLYKKNGPFVARKKTEDGKEFKISEAVWLQLRQSEPGMLYLKKNFSEEFSKISLARNSSRRINFPENLPQVRDTEKPISTAKYNDLMTLLTWVPKEFHAYYRNLPHNGNTPDFPTID